MAILKAKKKKANVDWRLVIRFECLNFHVYGLLILNVFV